MVEIGKKYKGKKYGFQGVIEILEINPMTDILRVKLTNKTGVVWEETWSFKDFNYGLSLDEYEEITETSD